MTSTTDHNRTYVRSAFKNLLSLFSLIFLSLPDEKVKKILRALLKARGRYLSELGNEGKYALNALNSVKAENVISAIEEQAKKLLKVRDKRVAVDFHAIPQYHKSKNLLARIKLTKGTTYGLVQIAIYLMGRVKGFISVQPVTEKNVTKNFKEIFTNLERQVKELGFKLTIIFADREFAVNEVLSFLVERGVDFVIAARLNMYKNYLKELEEINVTYAGVTYTGFLVKRHRSGAYLVILREGDRLVSFLVRSRVSEYEAIFLAEMYRRRWGIETAFRSLESFRIRTRTCDVRKELVIVLISYLIVNAWFILSSRRRIKLREFADEMISLSSTEMRGEGSQTSSKSYLDYPVCLYTRLLVYLN
ncbi:transposase [Sulfolobus sp. E11-6]|uniref:transposase n=1 Tax=Sulfolobus sp. E11-6 TaxID=2663020 RepID=UPI001EEC7142|nr:transposase [Sulfolobus sp. E11-6]